MRKAEKACERSEVIEWRSRSRSSGTVGNGRRGGEQRPGTGREFLDLKLKKRRADTQAKRLFRLGEKMESLHLQPFVLF